MLDGGVSIGLGFAACVHFCDLTLALGFSIRQVIFTPGLQQQYSADLILRSDETHQVLSIALSGHGSLDETHA